MATLAIVALALLGSAMSMEIHGPLPQPLQLQRVDGFSGFHKAWRTGDKAHVNSSLGNFGIGELYDMNMVSLNDTSNNPDFTSIHTYEGEVFILSQYESPNPAPFYISKMSQDKTSGALMPIWHKPVDFSEWGGLWVPCAGSVPTMGSHAGGEEYEPDALCWSDVNASADFASFRKCITRSWSKVPGMLTYKGLLPWGESTTDLDLILENINPYEYGYPFEVKITSAEGDVEVMKHLVMGRHSYELWYVAPDNVTVYSTDDGDSTAFWKFVADAPLNFSCGTLYGAKFNQTSDVMGGEFEISWIMLAKGCTADVKEMVKSVKFTDIFERIVMGDDECPDGFTSVRGNTNGYVEAECLKLKEGMQPAAAFLESRRLLAYLGGTAELSKAEGLTIANNGKMYMAMSQIRNAMEDNSERGKENSLWDKGGPNHIRLPYNPCGCIYVCDLSEDYNCDNFYAEVCGVYTGEDTGTGRNLGVCDVAGISEPDNVISIMGQNTILIGEDTGTVENDAVWEYDLDSKVLKRILTTPLGAESTTPYHFVDINGFDYIGAGVQHPYGESNQNKAEGPYSSGTAGWYGYWTFNHMAMMGNKLHFMEINPPRTEAEVNSLRTSVDAYFTPIMNIDGMAENMAQTVEP